MVTWKFKSCPRCGGDMFIDKDLDGWWYEKCLQCAYMRELKDLAEFRYQASQGERETVKAGKSGLKK